MGREFTLYVTPGGAEKAMVVLENGLKLLMRAELLQGREPDEYEILAMQTYATIETLALVSNDKAKRLQVVVPIQTDEDGKPIWYAYSSTIWDPHKENVQAVDLHYATI